MPDAVQFVCQSCRDEEIPEWLDSVRQEIQAGYVYVCYVHLHGFKYCVQETRGHVFLISFILTSFS